VIGSTASPDLSAVARILTWNRYPILDGAGPESGRGGERGRKAAVARHDLLELVVTAFQEFL
jgi:hypothetical protein